MTATASAILKDPHPRGHIVYPYTDEGLVGHAASMYASAGLRNGEGVILICAAANSDSIILRLIEEGFDIDGLKRSGRLVCKIAEDVLATFMVDGMPDEDKFKDIVGKMIIGIRTSAGGAQPGRVRIFGEMVSLLWKPNLAAAISLEEMWNRIIDVHGVSLMCTYSLDGCHGIPDTLHALHSHSIVD